MVPAASLADVWCRFVMNLLKAIYYIRTGNEKRLLNAKKITITILLLLNGNGLIQFFWSYKTVL